MHFRFLLYLCVAPFSQSVLAQKTTFLKERTGQNLGAIYINSQLVAPQSYTQFASGNTINGKYISSEALENETEISNSSFFDTYKNSFLIIPAKRKKQPFSIMLQGQGIATSNKSVPFWMRANKYGSIPLDGTSFSVIGNITHDYDTARRNKLLDWGMGIEGRMNAGKEIRGILVEGYLKARVSVIEIKAGRWKEIMGIVDPNLSTGAFAISGNALGIPKAQIGIPEYWNFPFTKGIIAFKGNLAFGTFGETPLRSQTRFKVKTVDSYYHQKSLYGRIGKPSWKVKFYGGVNHQAMWGNEKQIYGPAFKLSETETLKYIFMGKAFGARNVESSKIGNHIGSVDQGLEIDFKGINVMAYHQFFFDVGALYYLANIKDGIWGISINNKKDDNKKIWDKIVVEFVTSKSQGGELDAKWTPSGDEDYYNNYIYAQGWGYEGENLGNPLFTGRKYARTDLPMIKYESHVNNRILAFHTAATGRVNDFWNYTCKLTYSRNSGTYGTSPIGNTTGGYRSIKPGPYFQTVGQFSGYLEVERPIFNNGYHLGAVLAVDQGKLLYNSVGGMIKLTKRW